MSNQTAKDFEKGSGFKIGSFNVIGENVKVGDDVQIMNNVEIRSDTEIGDRVFIDSGVKISGQCKIGSNVTIRYNSIIARNVIIEDGVFISPQVMFINVPFRLRGDQKKTIVRRGARIGTNATIDAGVEIGEDVWIGAKAFVKRDCPSPGIYRASSEITAKRRELDERIKLGENVRIGAGTVFELPLWTPYIGDRRERRPSDMGIEIGDNADIAGNCTLVFGCDRPTKIGEDVWIAHNSVIGHDCEIGRGTVISAGVTINGLVEIGEYCFISSGTVIQPRKRIGALSLIGTQSNVTRDIPEKVIAFGNPCQPIRANMWRPPNYEGST